MPDELNGTRSLGDFPLAWRWTQETHAKLSPAELELIRPIAEEEAGALCKRAVSELGIRNPPKCLTVSDESDCLSVARWLDQVIPKDSQDLWLVWDSHTAAAVSRDLFVRRWDDFWYPTSDDLSVMPTRGCWHLEMFHHGNFEFSTLAIEQPGSTRAVRSGK